MTSLAKLSRRERGTARRRPEEEGRSVITGETLAIVTGGAAQHVTKRQIVSFYLRGGMNAVLRLLRAWQNRRSVRLLLAMDDHQLADIGLRRSDVHDALSLAISEDPSMELTRRRLNRRSAERLQRAESRAGFTAEMIRRPTRYY